MAPFKLSSFVAALVLVAAPVFAQQAQDLSEIYLGSAPCRVLTGSGSPEGVVTASCGIYIDTSAQQTYEKTSGSGDTGWSLFGGLPSPTGAGTFLRSTGSAWSGSTLVLPNSATSGRIPYATGTNTWGDDADLTFDGSNLHLGGHFLPRLTDTYSIGAPDKLWDSSFISTMNALVFAETTQTLFGGYSTVGKQAGSFADDVSSVATTIDFGTAMTVGDFVLVRAHDVSGTIKAEYLEVGSNTSGTTYNVTRDLASSHGTDPEWAAGTPFLVLGQNGDGRLDLIAVDGRPRLVVNEQGSAYNQQNARCVLGNLNTYYGYGSNTYGLACGSDDAWIKVDAGNGLRIGRGGDTLTSVSSDGAQIAHWSISPGALTGDNIGLYSDHMVDQAIALGGSTNRAAAAFTSAVSDNWTIGGWFYASSSSGTQYPLYIGTNGGGSAQNGYGITISGGNWRGIYLRTAGAGGAVAIGTSGAVSTGTWTHVALRRSSGTATLFINGSASGTSTAAPTAPDGYFSVGALHSTGTTWANGMSGRVAHVFLAHTALSDGQIAAIASAGPSGAGLAPTAVFTGDYAGQSPVLRYYPLQGSADLSTWQLADNALTPSGVTSADGPGVAMEWARVEVGTGTNAAGIAKAITGSNVVGWAGARYQARGTAPLRWTAAGSFFASVGEIGGWTLGTSSLSSTNISLTSGAANTAHVLVGTGSNAGGLNSANGGSDIAIWAGSAHSGRASAPFRVTAAGALTATGATISGSVTSTSGTIAGLTLASGSMTATNLGVYSGAANTARVEVGTSTNVGGLNSGNGGSDICIWAGAAHSGRASAPFRVTCAGAVTATSGTFTGAISGSTITGSTFAWSTGEIGEDIGMYFDSASGDDTDHAVHWEGNSRIMERSDIASLHMRGPGNGTINIYSAAVGLFAASNKSVWVDTDGLVPGATSDNMRLGTPSSKFYDGTFSQLSGGGTVHVCANNDGTLVPC